MENYYVVIAGNGTTSRANLEALLEDHFYTKGANGTVHVVDESSMTQVKVFAQQFAKDKSKPVHVGGLQESFSKTDPKLTACFIVWSDEDSESRNALALAASFGIPCYDLTQGLLPINPASDISQEATPTIPEAEQLTPAPILAAVTVEEELEDEDDIDEEDEDLEDDDEEYDEDEASSLYFGIEAIAKIFAKAVVEELEKSRKASKG